MLHPTYIDACKEAGQMVWEDHFEWGNPRNGFFDQGENSIQDKCWPEKWIEISLQFCDMSKLPIIKQAGQGNSQNKT